MLPSSSSSGAGAIPATAELQPTRPQVGSLMQRRTSGRSMLRSISGSEDTPEIRAAPSPPSSRIVPLQLDASHHSVDTDDSIGPPSTVSSCRSVDASGKKRISMALSTPATPKNAALPTLTTLSGLSSANNNNNNSHNSNVTAVSTARALPTLPVAHNAVVAKAIITQFPQTVTPRDPATNVWNLRSIEKNSSPCRGLRFTPMLPEQSAAMRGRITLALDIDETLVHASFDKGPCDLRMKLNVTPDETCSVYVNYRPGLHEFLSFCCRHFEVVTFTASQKIYADPLLDSLESATVKLPLRLYREHCTSVSGSYVKDLFLLGRSLDRIAIIDNSPVAYTFQRRNAIPIVSWFNDQHDRELEELQRSVLTKLLNEESVYPTLDAYNALVAVHF